MTLAWARALKWSGALRGRQRFSHKTALRRVARGHPQAPAMQPRAPLRGRKRHPAALGGRGGGGDRGGGGVRTQALPARAEAPVVTFSPKVFVPLTTACRDACGYCTFRDEPNAHGRVFMTEAEVLAVARRGLAAGATECLFTLGDRPESRYALARQELQELGCSSTPEYLARCAAAVLRETGLLPHCNAGVLSDAEVEMLRGVSASQGLMLEATATRLLGPGEAHAGCQSKRPAARLAVVERAGRLRIPFTSGILVGIGETREERLDAIHALAELHERFGHLQEMLVQNFRAKADTPMADAPEPTLEELLWTVRQAKRIFGDAVPIQVPPNLTPGEEQEEGWAQLLHAGVTDWGGVSPVTPDFVSPEAPWPHVERLAEATHRAGYALAPRLAVGARFVAGGAADEWLAPEVATAARKLADGDGLSRASPFMAGLPSTIEHRAGVVGVDASGVVLARVRPPIGGATERLLARLEGGATPNEEEVSSLLRARGGDFDAVVAAADRMRAEQSGDGVGFVVNRNINYTNTCTYACQFCAFSKGKAADELRGEPYLLDEAEVERRTAEAYARGATEVCMQGGIHPSFDGETYVRFLRAAKRGAPDIHVHAFSPLEVHSGAASLGVSVPDFLARLRDEGLGSLPGTAAEVLDDAVRDELCPDKLSADEWIEVVRAAHRVGLHTTSTIMFGHVDADGPSAWARHLLRLRGLHAETGGFTEFVPLPFVHMEAPVFLKGRARRGPTFRESVLAHAVGRLVLGPVGLTNVQASWVKLGPELAAELLRAGANDMGGVLMNESITRAAGASHGQELSAVDMIDLISAAGRAPFQRTTLYGEASPERSAAALAASGSPALA